MLAAYRPYMYRPRLKMDNRLAIDTSELGRSVLNPRVSVKLYCSLHTHVSQKDRATLSSFLKLLITQGYQK